MAFTENTFYIILIEYLRKPGVFVVLIFAIIFSLISIVGSKRERKLLHGHSSTKAEITAVNKSNRSGGQLHFKFRFYVGVKLYQSSTLFGCGSNNFKLQNVMRNKKLRVVYEPANPGNNELLFTKTDYLKFKMDIPTEDSSILSFIETTCTETSDLQLENPSIQINFEQWKKQ